MDPQKVFSGFGVRVPDAVPTKCKSPGPSFTEWPGLLLETYAQVPPARPSVSDNGR